MLTASSPPFAMVGLHALTIFDAALLGLVALSTLLLFRALQSFWWNPASIRRKLQQQGLHVLPCYPVFGNVREVIQLEAQRRFSNDVLDLASVHDIVPYVLPFQHKYGKEFVFWRGTQPTLVVTAPENVKQILSDDFKHYMKSKTSFGVLHRLLGGGLILADGEDWHNHRNILRPAFFADKLKGMVADMSASALGMAESWEFKIVKGGGQSAEVEVAHDLKNATADIIARTCFGSSYQEGKAVFEKQVFLLELLIKNFLANTLLPGYKFLPIPSNLQTRELEKSIDKDLRQIVQSRRKLVSEGDAPSYGVDLLGLILADEDKSSARLSTQEVMDECKTFFFAGHETTSNLLAWTMMLLSLHPEWQEQARKEVLDVFGKEAEPKADQLPKMRIMGMILNESLRLYPPAPQLSNRATALHDGELKLGQLSLPRDMGFSIPTLVIHRDKDLWGKDADEFRPDRFSEGASKACKHPYGFLPFGVGPRTCIGQSFAIMEAKVIMATILQRFQFRLSPNYKHAPKKLVTLTPKYGMQVILERI